MKTSDKILEYLKDNNQATVNELVSFLDLSRVAVSKQLKNLLEKNEIYKAGKPPKVFYFIKNKKKQKETEEISRQARKVIEKNYLTITASGERKEGLEGFVYWCEKNNLPVEKTAEEYLELMAKYKSLKRNGLISGIEKFKQTFDEVYLDKVFYLDFYSIERFGKTKLGQLLLYAKQSHLSERTKIGSAVIVLGQRH